MREIFLVFAFELGKKGKKKAVTGVARFQNLLYLPLKAKVHLKIILSVTESSFIYPQVVSNLDEFLSSAEHKGIYFEVYQ